MNETLNTLAKSFAARAKLIAITNWTLHPHMTRCWRRLQRDVFSKLTHRPWFFFDLVDPRSRSKADIREKLGVSQVVTHCLKIAALADATGTACVEGPFCPKPKKSVGAGDRFNAGFCLAQLLDLPAEQRLLLGSAASGFFVRNARSATADELAEFVAAWARGLRDSAA